MSSLALTHWGRVTHICVGKLTIIGSDNGLSPGRRQAIVWTNAAILLIRHLGTNFNEILLAIYTFSFEKMHLKMSSVKWRPFCLGLNVLTMRSEQDGFTGEHGLRWTYLKSLDFCSSLRHLTSLPDSTSHTRTVPSQLLLAWKIQTRASIH